MEQGSPKHTNEVNEVQIVSDRQSQEPSRPARFLSRCDGLTEFHDVDVMRRMRHFRFYFLSTRLPVLYHGKQREITKGAPAGEKG